MDILFLEKFKRVVRKIVKIGSSKEREQKIFVFVLLFLFIALLIIAFSGKIGGRVALRAVKNNFKASEEPEFEVLNLDLKEPGVKIKILNYQNQEVTIPFEVNASQIKIKKPKEKG